MSGIVRAVHQSSSKLGDTPLVRLDLFESLPSRRFGCRASTTNSTTKSRSTSLYNAGASSRGGCRALQLYSAPERSTSLQLYSALHSTSSTPSLTQFLALANIPEGGLLTVFEREREILQRGVNGESKLLAAPTAEMCASCPLTCVTPPRTHLAMCSHELPSEPPAWCPTA